MKVLIVMCLKNKDKMKVLLQIILLSMCISGSSQIRDTATINKDIDFVNYLIGTSQYSDAIYLLNQIDFNKPGLKRYRDSLNYLKGWAYYNIKSLDSASLYLLRTAPNTLVGTKSRFFAAYNSIYQGNEKQGNEILQSMSLIDPQWIELRYLQQAGVALLNRDYSEYELLQKNFTSSWYSLTDAEDKLNQYHTLLSKRRKKSPWIAGCMSMIIPGSGKMYSGKIGEGVSALLSHAILAGITIENYKKAGPGNFKTIFFGSLFSVFYLGNIYGSMISVQVSNNEFNKIYDNKILFDIHIPLRTVFN
jgi:hypothetical protein